MNDYLLNRKKIHSIEMMNLVIYIEDYQHKLVSLNCSYQEVQQLISKSEYLATLIANFTSVNEECSQIYLKETNSSTASEFIIYLLQEHVAESVYWRKDWAILSVKWIISSYVEIYANFIESAMESMLKRLAVSQICEPRKVKNICMNIELFKEMYELIRDYECYCVGPIKSREDLIERTKYYPSLRVQEIIDITSY